MSNEILQSYELVWLIFLQCTVECCLCCLRSWMCASWRWTWWWGSGDEGCAMKNKITLEGCHIFKRLITEDSSAEPLTLTSSVFCLQVSSELILIASPSLQLCRIHRKHKWPREMHWLICIKWWQNLGKQSLSSCDPSISRLPPSVIATLMLGYNELFRADSKRNIVTWLFKQTQFASHSFRCMCFMV